MLNLRSIFIVNVPVGLLGLWLAPGYIAATRGRGGRSLDLPGQILAIATSASATYCLIDVGRTHAPSAVIVAFGVSSVALGTAFVTVEARQAEPMLPLDLLLRPALGSWRRGGGCCSPRRDRHRRGPLPLLLPLCAVGGGAGVTTPSMSLAVLDAAERERSGLASGILNSARQTGVVVGAALLGALLGDPASLGGARAAVLAATAAFACACTVAIAVAVAVARRHGASLWR